MNVSKFNNDGFLIIKNIFTINEIKKFQIDINNFLNRNLKKKVKKFILLVKKLTQYIILKILN